MMEKLTWNVNHHPCTYLAVSSPWTVVLFYLLHIVIILFLQVVLMTGADTVTAMMMIMTEAIPITEIAMMVAEAVEEAGAGAEVASRMVEAMVMSQMVMMVALVTRAMAKVIKLFFYYLHSEDII